MREHSPCRGQRSVRPHSIAGIEDAGEEAVAVRGQRLIQGPTREEYEAHMRTHMPFRSWCSCCVRGKSDAPPHRTVKDGRLEEMGKGSIPVISVDYGFMGSRDRQLAMACRF